MLNLKELQEGYKLYRHKNGIFVRGFKTMFKNMLEWPAFNDFPTLYASWQEAYTRNQNRYNLIFVGGLVAAIGSIVLLTSSGERENPNLEEKIDTANKKPGRYGNL